MSEEDAVALLMSSDFLKQAAINPRITDALATHPFAANMFYNSQEFKTWSADNPDNAKKMMDAAMKWEKMSTEDKDKFFAEHPNLGNLSQSGMGSSQGGATDKQMKGKGGAQGGTTTQPKSGGY